MLKFSVGLVGNRCATVQSSSLDLLRSEGFKEVGVKVEGGLGLRFKFDIVCRLPFLDGERDRSVSESVSEWSRFRVSGTGVEVKIIGGVVALPLGSGSGRSEVTERPRDCARVDFKKALSVDC